jgi:hypothetical protein
MKAQFTVGTDGLVFQTRTNGDKIIITKIHLEADDAANLAKMINTDGELKVTIKDVQEE